MRRKPHWLIVCEFLESRRDGATAAEVSAATGIQSFHRRVTGKETPKGWRLWTEQRGPLFYHFAARLVGGNGEGFQGPLGPVPKSDANTGCESQVTSPRPAFNPTQVAPVPSDEPSDAELEAQARATAARIGLKLPAFMREKWNDPCALGHE